jgi:hypothetical protein
MSWNVGDGILRHINKMQMQAKRVMRGPLNINLPASFS